MSDLTRAEIGAVLPEGTTFTLRKVSFSDLARDEAYSIKVKRAGVEMPSLFTSQDLEDWSKVLKAIRLITQHTHKGKRILS